MNFKQKLAYMALGCIFTALGYLFITWLWDEAHKSAEDGVAAYERGDYKKAVKIWHPLAKQGDGSAKRRLQGMFIKAQKEMVWADYKTAAEMLRPLAAIGYPLRTRSYFGSIKGISALSDRFQEAKDKAKDDAEGGGPNRVIIGFYDAKYLLDITEFLIQEDREFYN